MDSSETPPQRNLFYTYALWTFLGFLLFLGGLFFFLKDDPIKPASKQLEAIIEGDENKAYSNYTSDDFRAAASFNAFKNFLALHPIFRKQPTLNLKVTEKDSTSATLQGELIAKNGEISSVEYKVIKEDGKWKIDTLTFLDILPQRTVAANDLEALKDPVESQLTAIKNKNINKAYYNIVSDEFQRTTSYKDFEKFVNENPILTSYSRKEFINEDIDGNEGKLTIKLYQGSIETPIEYRLKRSKGQWKIWSLKVIVPPKTEANDSPSSTHEIAHLFEIALEPIKENNIAKAYYQSTSRSFRAHTSLDNFRELIKNNPAIKQGQPEYYQSLVADGMAVFKVNLQDPSKPVLLKVSMRKENGNWKIDSLEVASSPPKLWASQVKKTDQHDLIAELSPADLKPKTAITSPTTITQNTITPTPPTIITSEPARETPQPADVNNSIYTVDQWFKSLRVGDPTMAYRSYTSEGFKNANSLETFLNFTKTYPILSTITPKLSLLEIKNNYATINGELTANSSNTIVNFLLIKENNQWKILAIDISLPKILIMPSKEVIKEEKKPTTVQPSPQPASSSITQPAPAATPPAPAWSSASAPATITSPGINPLSDKPKRLPRSEYEPADLIPPIQQLLGSVRHSDYSAAYQYFTTKSFQKVTTYDQFRKVMQRLPAVSQGTVSFSKPIFSGDNGLVTAKFSGPFGTAILDFTLIYEEGQWKIQGLNISGTTNPSDVPTGTPITEKPNPLPPENLNPSSIEYPIQLQLYLITTGDINRSYFDLTSKSFQKLTNLQEYNNFISSYPAFLHNTNYTIQTRESSNDSGSFLVTLTSKQGEQAITVYDLVKENNQWRILNIQVQDYQAPPKGISAPVSKEKPIRLAPMPDNPQQSPGSDSTSKLNFSNGAFGNSVNDEGLIQQPTLLIPKGSKNIYFNLFVEDASKGDLVTLNFKHLKSGTTIPEIRSGIRHSGNSTLSFIFASPPDGWPEGIYEVKANANNGATKTYSFRIQ